MKTKYVDISNYATVADIFRILKDHGVKPEDAEIEVETYQDSDSYGNISSSSTMFLRFQVEE